MASIKDDLIGAVWVEVDGRLTALYAGDAVPDGVEVGDHVLDTDDDTPPEGDYSTWKLPQLQKEIAVRNEGRDDEDLLPTKGTKAELAAALVADDE